MDKKTASKLLRGFADLEFQDSWKEYCQLRIDNLHKAMEQGNITENEFRGYQGQIKILRDFLKLRDTAVAVIHEGN